MKRNSIGPWSLTVACCAAGLFSSSTPVVADAVEIVGFSQPYETVQVAAADLGIISSCCVREGDEVVSGQAIAELDSNVLRATLAAAQAKAEFEGPRRAAEAALRQRNSRLTHMQELHADGHASAEELERAEVDRDIAAANLITAREETKSHNLNVEQIQAQLERRIIRSPIDGVVTKVARRRGELVTTNDALVATIVRLNQLRATFYVPTDRSDGLLAGGTVPVRFVRDDSVVPALVEFVSPITDADSDTVRIEVVIDNHLRRHRSGVRCLLLAGDHAPPLGARRHTHLPLARTNPLRAAVPTTTTTTASRTLHVFRN